MESLEHTLDKEHEKTKALEHKLLRRKGGVTCLCSTFLHHSSCVEPGAGPSSQPDNAALIEQIELATTTVVTDDILWQPGGVSIEDWSDEVTTLKTALSKRRMQRGFIPPEPQKGLFDTFSEL